MGPALRRAVLGRGFRRQAVVGHGPPEQARTGSGGHGPGERRRQGQARRAGLPACQAARARARPAGPQGAHAGARARDRAPPGPCRRPAGPSASPAPAARAAGDGRRRRRDTTGPHATRDRDLAALASAPPPIPGALEDDPLTSPSFSLKSVPANDSRSYSNARKHAKPDVNGTAYPSAPPAAAPVPAPTAEWYSAPPAPAAPPAEAQTPAYGNPYQYTGGGNGGSAAGFADNQATAGYPGYLADPLRVYSPRGYDAPAPDAEPAAATVPYADGYSGHPYAEQAGYQDGYHTAGHAPGYER